MNRSFGLWQFSGFALTSLLGTLLHFLYDLTGGSLLVAPFSGTNESTFEHMKLLFWPMFLFALLQSLFFKERQDFLCIKLRGILLGLVLIPFLFYGYNGVIGKSPDLVNVAIFFLSAALAYLYETSLFKKGALCRSAPKRAFSALLCIALLFILFTFRPPRIALFKDPVTGGHGI
jgi:hypothetical protein